MWSPPRRTKKQHFYKRKLIEIRIVPRAIQNLDFGTPMSRAKKTKENLRKTKGNLRKPKENLRKTEEQLRKTTENLRKTKENLKKTK